MVLLPIIPEYAEAAAMSGSRNRRRLGGSRVLAEARAFGLLSTLAFVLAACTGSGSSGFDINAEGAAITQALQEQRCVDFEGLTICPADVTPTPVNPTTTPTPTATPSPFTTPTLGPGPTASPTIVPSTRVPTPAASATATPVVIVPTPGMSIDTGLEKDAPIACVALAADTGCGLTLTFTAQGFPPEAVFRVAVRTLDPVSPWTIGGEARPGADTHGAPDFEGPVAVQVPAATPGRSTRVQIAVLVFLTADGSVPPQVERLADSGADFAYVTEELLLLPES